MVLPIGTYHLLRKSECMPFSYNFGTVNDIYEIVEPDLNKQSAFGRS